VSRGQTSLVTIGGLILIVAACLFSGFHPIGLKFRQELIEGET